MPASPTTLRVVCDNIGTGYIPVYVAVGKECGPRRTQTLSPRPFVARERLYGFGSLGARSWSQLHQVSVAFCAAGSLSNRCVELLVQSRCVEFPPIHGHHTPPLFCCYPVGTGKLIQTFHESSAGVEKNFGDRCKTRPAPCAVAVIRWSTNRAISCDSAHAAPTAAIRARPGCGASATAPDKRVLRGFPFRHK